MIIPNGIGEPWSSTINFLLSCQDHRLESKSFSRCKFQQMLQSFGTESSMQRSSPAEKGRKKHPNKQRHETEQLQPRAIAGGMRNVSDELCKTKVAKNSFILELTLNTSRESTPRTRQAWHHSQGLLSLFFSAPKQDNRSQEIDCLLHASHAVVS